MNLNKSKQKNQTCKYCLSCEYLSVKCDALLFYESIYTDLLIYCIIKIYSFSNKYMERSGCCGKENKTK